MQYLREALINMNNLKFLKLDLQDNYLEESMNMQDLWDGLK